MKYSTKNELAQKVCDDLGYDMRYGFVSAAKKDEQIYVNFTLGKPEEVAQLCSRVRRSKYCLAPGFIKVLKHRKICGY